MRQKPWQRPGFRFQLGRLRINSDRVSYVLDAWPELKSLRRAADSRYWHETSPAFRVLKPSGSGAATYADADADIGPTENVSSAAVDPLLEKAQAFRLFRCAIPPEVTKVVETFPNRQWDLLQFCHHRRRFTELIESNPTLAYCVAQCDAIANLPHDIGHNSAMAALRCRWRLTVE